MVCIVVHGVIAGLSVEHPEELEAPYATVNTFVWAVFAA
jgi:hypothetical protein